MSEPAIVATVAGFAATSSLDVLGTSAFRADLAAFHLGSIESGGADLAVMEADARRQRGDRPFVFANLVSGEGVTEIVGALEAMGGQRSSEPRALAGTDLAGRRTTRPNSPTL